MANDEAKYYEDYILRKEGRSKWIQYWVVIRGVWMLFYRDRATTNRDNFRGSIELSSSTKCNIARRGNYSFPFYVSTERGTHLFKCDTNLKRHQWMCLIELASKGSPPIPAPLAVPSPTSVLTEDLIPSDTRPDHTEMDRPDSEPDEDDVSIPPGVILVTTPIDDSSHNEGASNGYGNSMESRHDPPVLGRAVLTTGITGTTRVARESSSSSSAPRHAVKTPLPKPSCSFQHTRGELSGIRKSSNASSFLGGLSPHSAQSWGRGSPERPSSSPSPTFERKYSAQQLTPKGWSRDNVRFSRHMVRSAPDIKILSLDDHV